MPPEIIEVADERQPLLTVQEVAVWLAVSEPTVRREVERGKLRAKRVGRQLRFRPDWVEEFLRRR